MTAPDKLNLTGILITGAGSTIAMLGIYMQVNGYVDFGAWDFFVQLKNILLAFLCEGSTKGMQALRNAALIKDMQKEDRGKSLLGFYLVAFGFFFQMLGSAFLLAALRLPPPPENVAPVCPPKSLEKPIH